METRKIVFDPEHSDTLISMGNLASTFWKSRPGSGGRETRGASPVYKKESVRIWSSKLDTLISMGNLASRTEILITFAGKNTALKL